MQRGLGMCRDLAQTRALAGFVGREVTPGPEVAPGRALRAYIAASAASCKHYVDTCRVGRDGDAVVDDRLRVHGVQGLRVVDASIMPRLPAAHTNAPTIMVAERAADLIRGEA